MVFLGERRLVLDARLVDFREVFREDFLVVRFAMMRCLSVERLSGEGVPDEKGHDAKEFAPPM